MNQYAANIRIYKKTSNNCYFTWNVRFIQLKYIRKRVVHMEPHWCGDWWVILRVWRWGRGSTQSGCVDVGLKKARAQLNNQN